MAGNVKSLSITSPKSDTAREISAYKPSPFHHFLLNSESIPQMRPCNIFCAMIDGVLSILSKNYFLLIEKNSFGLFPLRE